MVLVDATQWFKDGDHPYVQGFPPSPGEQGNPYCPLCGNLMRRHGFLYGVNGEETICPSDYIVSDRQGRPYRMSRGEFESQYEPYVRPPKFAPVPISDLEQRKQARSEREGP
jgi:hypothetical protein